MRSFLIVTLLVSGCDGPPAAEPPVPVRAADLARAYRDEPETARRAYTDRPVLIALTNPVRRGCELHWHLGSPDFPAVVVCRFACDPPDPAPVVWLAGTCRGAVPDGHARELTGYGFCVVVTDCRAAGPPKQ